MRSGRRLRPRGADGASARRAIRRREAWWGYARGVAAGRAVLGNGDDWVGRLPGGRLQSVMGHGMARLAEFLQGDDPVVMAHAFTSRALAERGGEDVLDELRVM